MVYIVLCTLLVLSSLSMARQLEASTRKKPKCDSDSSKDQSQLNSFLWTIHRDPPSYFFGTIHVPYTRVWDYIPQNTKHAFRQAGNVFFELDLTDPYTITSLANCQLLPHGANLSDVLPRDIYIRLKEHLEYVRLMMPGWMSADQKGRGLYADYLFNAIAGNWERKRPVWVMLMVNSLTESDIKSRGIPVLDLYLAQSAERIGKVTGAVEHVEEQCVPLNELNFSQVLFALNQTLFQHEAYRTTKGSVPYTTEDLIDHYNCGDLNSIIFNHDTAQVPNLVNSSLPPSQLKTAKRIDQYFRSELIVKRNHRMSQRVMTLLKKYPKKSFFFAFGAGHFLGNNTIINHLQEAGFNVTHTASDEEIPVLPESHNSKKSNKPRRNFLADVTSEFPLPSDVLYGDIQYLFKKRIRHEQRRRKQRRKQMKARQRQKQLDALWSSLDVDSLPFDHRGKRKRKKNSGGRKTFNDLWVRMEGDGPDYLQEAETPPKHRQTTFPPVNKYSFYQSGASNLHSTVLLLCLAIMICYTNI
ncbi:metalloprotease TIKI1-like isoform X1 [Haliotis rubra]|uniref:metalloprotease TIKI1-like isoform X1 n=1 Tax=Haliotis rubra TaxID=36100 RepID=UPI001EE5D7B8|nr:metalloprotease TIKI1-like isoform X1 [Haliotis rubra]